MKLPKILSRTGLISTLPMAVAMATAVAVAIFAPPAARAANAMFHSVNTTYGLSAREVYSIAKDDEGFIWGASKTGILRVSDIDARIYQLPLASTDSYITKLVFQNSKLFTYCNNGQIFLHDRLYDRFDLLLDLRKALGDPFINVTGLVVDGDMLWVATSNGLYVWSNMTLTRAYPDSKAINQIQRYSELELMVATDDGLAIFDTVTSRMDYFLTFTDATRVQVSSLLVYDDSDVVWAGTVSNGLFACNPEQGSMEPVAAELLPRQPVLAIRRHKESLFVGIDGQGVWEMQTDGLQTPDKARVLNVYREDENNPYSLHGDGVYDIFCDGDQRVWIATFTGGLSWFDGGSSEMDVIDHQINDPNSLANNNINRVLEDSRGNIWFATDNGLSRWRVASDKWDTFLHNNLDVAKVFLALCEDDDGNIWAGTYSSGVYVLDGDTGEQIYHHFYRSNGEVDPSAQFISDIYKDGDGNIWLGGTQSVLCYLRDAKRFRRYSRQPVNAMTEYSPRTMLLGCVWGLVSLNKENGRMTTLLDNCRVQDLVVVEDAIWMATSGDGLVCYDRRHNTMYKFTTDSGILSNYINSLTWAGGYLWLGTESGLCRFDTAEGTALAYPSVFTGSRESYNPNAHFDMSNGNIVWGTNRGAIIVDPLTLPERETELGGRIFIQDITVAGLSIRETGGLLRDTPVNRQTRLVLNHRQDNLTVELLPLNMYGHQTRFSWKMEGLDEEWSQPSNRTFAVYYGLRSGSYRLDVAMYDNSLSRIIDRRSIEIRVRPPFWATWWFRMIVVLTVACAAVVLAITWSSRMKQHHMRDKLKFFTQMAHDLRTSLMLINAPVEQLHNSANLPPALKYFSGLAVEQAGKLATVTTQLLDFEKMDLGKEQLFLATNDLVELLAGRIQMFCEQGRKRGIAIRFSPTPASYRAAVDQLKFEKIVDNLVSNALKYSSPDSTIDIRFEGNDRVWSLEVKDYGLGISEKEQKNLFREFHRGDNPVNSHIAGSGIGLLLVKRYVDMHGGRIELTSRENEGSSFRITVPFRMIDAERETPAPAPELAPAPDTALVPVAVDTASALAPVPAPSLHAGQFLNSDGNDNERVSLRRTNILVVEDNDQLRDFLKNVLQESYTVSVAADGHEAWVAIGKKMPDLVISDIVMPDMDGFELCRLVKSTFRTAHIPLVLLTSLSAQTKQLEGLGLGADDYITKPFDVTVLTGRIASILRNRNYVRERTLRVMNDSDNRDETLFANHHNDQFIKRAIDVVKANMTVVGFGKDDFASEMNVSSSLLYQKIKSLTGNSPMEFIRSIRFNHAAELLRSGYSIAEASDMCGFSTPNYFGTAFRKYFGYPPTTVTVTRS